METQRVDTAIWLLITSTALVGVLLYSELLDRRIRLMMQKPERERQ